MQEKYGFVYIWYDRKRKKYYIGSHWGTENDRYICSSNIMRKAYNRRKEDFSRRIIGRVYTNRNDLLEQEHNWLLLAESRKDRYYNISFMTKNSWWCDVDQKLTVGQKISKSKKGQGVGRKHSEETKAKMRLRRHDDAWKAANSIRNSGKILSEESKAKLRGIKRSEETKQKMSDAQRKMYSFVSPDGETFITGNLMEFCEERGLCVGTMRCLANGTYKRNSLKGWTKA